MPEMRHDPVQRRWVIIASHRSARPTDFVRADKKELPVFNPFEEGNESETPPEVYAWRSKSSRANERGWKVRVVPNRFPVLKIEGDLDREGVGLYDKMNGIGAHEVVIESPDRFDDLSILSIDHAVEVGKAYRARLIDLMKDRRFKYVLIFRNHGEMAGSSLTHPHSQITALPVTPLVIAQELESAKKHFSDKERCLFCDLLSQEIKDGQRIIDQNEHFVAYAPFASRFPFEIALAPRKHSHDFRTITDDKLRLFMDILQRILQRLNIALDNPAYNFMLHTAPNTESFTPRPTHWATLQYDWHWHLELIPRLTNIAGFEWGSGIFINNTPPEQAAEILRSVELD
ncbi:DUF4931 domain-containing protein [bacterium]|nr:DUF4931 domain-containing protein [bacterium]